MAGRRIWIIDDMVKYLIKNRLLQVLVHIIAWGLFLSLLTSLVPKPPNMNPVLSIIIPDLFFISFYYINFYFLVPRFFFPRRFLIFAGICAGYLILTIAVPSSISGSAYGRPEFREPGKVHEFRSVPPPPDMNQPGFRGPDEQDIFKGKPPARIRLFIPEFSYTIFVFLFILTLSTGIRILIEWQRSEKEKVKAELAFLKAQINPHFLFNALNSIYSMAVTGDKKTSDAIELFSDLMRYVLYESSHDFMPLETKLHYIDTYLQLQKLRLSSDVKLDYVRSGDPAGLFIAPLTLMPFIENAFKHGVSTERESFIYISVEIKDIELILCVKNSITSNITGEPEPSQLGIGNTIKRLDLLYKGRYKLDIDESGDIFTVNLHMKLR